MAKNPFQAAVVEVNCLINGQVDQPGDGPTAEEQWKAQGPSRLIRFLKGNASKQKGSTSSPSKDCQEGDEDSPLQLHVEGFGHVEGLNLAGALTAMRTRVTVLAAEGTAAAAEERKIAGLAPLKAAPKK